MDIIITSDDVFINDKCRRKKRRSFSDHCQIKDNDQIKDNVYLDSSIYLLSFSLSLR